MRISDWRSDVCSSDLEFPKKSQKYSKVISKGLAMRDRSSIRFSMKKLDNKKRAQILHMLVEGNSLRATARMADVACNTVDKLQIGRSSCSDRVCQYV